MPKKELLKVELKPNIIIPKSFNYIGSKIKLLNFIGDSIEKYIGKELNKIESFFDCFSGTGVVSHFMMQKGIKNIISNDIQYYAEIISSVWTTKDIDITKLKHIITDINTELSEIKFEPSENDFVCNNFTTFNSERMYFSEMNGFKIDKTRQKIETLKKDLTNQEYKCLLKIMLYAITNVSNITSVYGSYLKSIKKSALKNFILDEKIFDWLVKDDNIVHESFNQDIIELLDSNELKDKVECVYLDSPYNRGYYDNYHVLETITKYDSPKLKGKTGLRDLDCEKAKSFTLKTKTEKSFLSLFEKLKSKYIFVSYSSESIVSKNKMIEMLNDSGWEKIECIEYIYPRFKSNKNGHQEKDVIEYLFCGQKK